MTIWINANILCIYHIQYTAAIDGEGVNFSGIGFVPILILYNYYIHAMFTGHWC